MPVNIEFTSCMNRRELILALIWLPIHVIGLPFLGGWLLAGGILTAAQANLLIYALGVLYLLIAEFTYLRREFDPICDRVLYCALQIVSCYLIMMAFNMLSSGVVSLAERLFGSDGSIDNLNNDTIMDMASREGNITAAMAVYLAPIVEEVLFRGAVFAGIREKNRTAAYVVSICLFGLYHVWGYAMSDPTYWLYILQYVPAGFLLCRCYEKTNSIWSSIFFHMLTNGVALQALTELSELL